MQKFFMIFIAIIFTLSISRSYSADYWQRLDGPNGGNVNCLVSSPTQYVFAGSPADGIYRKFNSSNTWESCSLGLDGLNISAMLASSDGILYASVYGTGIYKSTNNGDNWIKCFILPQNNLIKAMAFNKKGDIIAKAPGAGIIRSTDAGKSWDTINTGFGNNQVSALAACPDGILYAGTNIGVFSSVDNGDTWQMCDTVNMKSKVIRSLAVTSNGWIYAGTASQISRSQDSGKSFQAIMNGIYDTSINTILTTNDSLMFIGTSINTYSTSNYGDKWNMFPYNINLYNVISWTLDSSGNIYSGNTYQGLFLSKDKGINWELINNGYSHPGLLKIIPYVVDIIAGSNSRILYQFTNNAWNLAMFGQQVTGLGISPQGDIFIGTMKNGTIRSLDKGKTFEPCPSSDNYDISTFLFDSNKTIYGCKGANENGAGITVTKDYGVLWVKADSGLGHQPVYGIAYDKNKRIAALTDTGFFYLANGSDKWIYENTFPRHQRVSSLIIFGSTYVVGTDTMGVMVSDDNGVTWNNPLHVSRVVAIARNIYGQIFAATATKGIYQSDDNAKTFVILPDLPIQSTVTDIRCTDKNYLLVASDRGAFKSTIKTDIGKTDNQNVIPKIRFINHNESVDIINESNEEYLSIDLYNLFGQNLKHIEGYDNYKMNINFSEFYSGVYLLVVKEKGKILTSEKVQVVK